MDNLDLKKQVGERLKNARRDIGLTQTEIAKEMHMTQQQYSRFENGKFELNYGQLIFLAKKYDISIDYLLGLNEF